MAIGVAVGTSIAVATKEPVWIAVGVALGAALGISKTEKRRRLDAKKFIYPAKLFQPPQLIHLSNQPQAQ
jgi:hypothetical protein